jgi:hypothetical protein
MPGRLFRSLVLLPLVLATATAVGLAQENPLAIFTQAVDARNRGDLDGMMTSFAEDAVRQDGSCPTGCSGVSELRRTFQDNIGEHFQATVLDARIEGDTRVLARAELRSDRFRALGAERVLSNFTIELRDGKIVRWASTLEAADGQTAAFMAALRAQTAQVAPTPAPVQLPRVP